MDLNAFTNANGSIVQSNQGVSVFVPRPLPPSFEYDKAITPLIAESHTKLGRLSGIGELLPNPHILISPYLRREAVLSSKIEGTQASLADLFQYELIGTEPVESVWKRVFEVRNYVRALERGLRLVRKEGGRIDLGLIRSMHGTLLQGVRGAERNPGNFREIQVLIGSTPRIEDATYVPPAAEYLPDLLSNLEDFIRSPPSDMPILVQCAVLHYQFEAVHPFVDGNGRIGRLLIPLFLCERNILPHALLYISAYLESHRTEYFDRLLGVSQRNEWKEWVAFFLTAVAHQSDEAVVNIQKLLKLKERYETLIRKRHATKNAHLLKDILFSNPYTTIKNASEFLSVSFVTAQSTIQALVSSGILTEITRKKRNKIFVAKEIIRNLS